MSDEQAFLRMILDHPEANLPRLVFADWLEEQGLPRGEFIRVQMELAERENTDEDVTALRRREAELLAVHRLEWAGVMPRMVYLYAFRRGFVEEITLTAARLASDANDLFNLAPIRLLRLVNVTPRTWAEVLALPQLRQITALHLTDSFLTDEMIRQLAQTESLSNLQTLRLGNTNLGDRAIEFLSRSGVFRNLRRLVLRDNRISDLGVYWLANARCLSRLRSLDLHGNQVGPAGAMALAESPALGELTCLDLTSQYPGELPPPSRQIQLKHRQALLERFGELALVI